MEPSHHHLRHQPLLALVKISSDGVNMIRFYRRLQVYALTSLLLGITLWILVPNTRSQNIRKRYHRSAPATIQDKIIHDEDINDVDLKPLKQLFKKADTTADGLISTKELTWAIQRQS